MTLGFKRKTTRKTHCSKPFIHKAPKKNSLICCRCYKKTSCYDRHMTESLLEKVCKVPTKKIVGRINVHLSLNNDMISYPDLCLIL